MSRAHIDWNLPAFAAVRRLPGVQSWVSETAENVAAAANSNAGIDSGFVASARNGRNRYRAIIYPGNQKALSDCYRHNTMLTTLEQSEGTA